MLDVFRCSHSSDGNATGSRLRHDTDQNGAVGACAPKRHCRERVRGGRAGWRCGAEELKHGPARRRDSRGREDTERQTARERVKFYKDRGYAIQYFDLAEKS